MLINKSCASVDLLVIVNEGFQSLWYEISVGDSIFNNTCGCQAFERQIIHDWNIVDRIRREH